MEKVCWPLLCALLHELQCKLPHVHLLLLLSVMMRKVLNSRPTIESSSWHGLKGCLTLPNQDSAREQAAGTLWARTADGFRQNLLELPLPEPCLAAAGSLGFLRGFPEVPKSQKKCPEAQEGIKKISKTQKLLYKLLCLLAACWTWMKNDHF